LGIGKTGGFGSNSSGDIFLAFSTATTLDSGKKDVIRAEMLQNDAIDPVLKATVQATEESVNNALIAAEDMEGINGNTVFALPHEELVNILKHHRVRTE
jgi:L-aminopeptidase/D-esterase-like protein